MLHDFNAEHWVDEEGKPAGGISQGVGFVISWQNGPLGRGGDRREPNGAFVETVIAAVKDRIHYYQRGEFACEENEEALSHLSQALDALNERTQRREAAGIEGTHAEEANVG